MANWQEIGCVPVIFRSPGLPVEYKVGVHGIGYRVTGCYPT